MVGICLFLPSYNVVELTDANLSVLFRPLQEEKRAELAAYKV